MRRLWRALCNWASGKKERVVTESEVEIEVDRVIVETDSAIGFDFEGEMIWIPKKLISAESEVTGKGDSGTLIIPRWIAKQRGLV